MYDGGVELADRLKTGRTNRRDAGTLRKAATSFDHGPERPCTGGMITDTAGDVIVLSALTTDDSEASLAAAPRLWDGYKAKLDPVLRFSGSPYATQPAAVPLPPKIRRKHTQTNVQLSPRGRRLQSALTELNQYGASSHEQLARVSGDLAAQVEADSRRAPPARCAAFRSAAWSRPLLLLGAIFFYFARNLRKEEAVANRASARKPRTFCAR